MSDTNEFFSKIPFEEIEEVVKKGALSLPEGFELTKETTATDLIQAFWRPNTTLSGEEQRKNRYTIEKVLQANEIDLASEKNIGLRVELSKDLGRGLKEGSIMECHMKNFALAKKMLIKYIAKSQENNQRDYDAEVLLGAILIETSEYKEVLTHLKSLEDLEDSTCIERRDHLLYYIAIAYQHLSEWHEAKNYFKRVLDISNDEKIIAFCFVRLINCCLSEFRKTNAKDLIEEAEEYVDIINTTYKKHIVEAYSYLGEIYRRQGHSLSIILQNNKEEQNIRKQKHIDLFQKVIQMEEISPGDKSYALYMLGKPFNRGEYNEYSITHLENALSIMNGKDIMGGEITWKLAEAYLATKQYEKAEELLQKCLHINTLVETHKYLILLNLFMVQYQLKKYESCIETYNNIPKDYSIKEVIAKKYYNDAVWAFAQQQQPSPAENNQTPVK